VSGLVTTTVPNSDSPENSSICSKINHKCNKNGIVIGDDLYQQVKNIKEYNFKNIGKHVLDKKNIHQIHSVKRKITKQKMIKNS